MSEPIRLGRAIDCVPSIHGSSVFAQEVRRLFLAGRYDRVAVELPPSLGPAALEAVGRLPLPTAVVYEETVGSGSWAYVPIEPADSIVEAMRLAVGERIPIEFVAREVDVYEGKGTTLPDEYAVKRLGLARFYEAVGRFLPFPEPGSQDDDRERWMAARLRQLDEAGGRTLWVGGLAHLSGVRWHFDLAGKPWEVEPPEVRPLLHDVAPESLYFLMRELPYLVHLYERCRRSLDLAEYDQTDGLKELLLDARREYKTDRPLEEGTLSPGRMQTLLRYLRNLCLIQNRLTPMLWELVVAARGVGGGLFARQVVELAKYYPYMDPTSELPVLRLGIDEGVTDGLGRVKLKTRLPGPPIAWRNVRLEADPKREKKVQWRHQWNPYGQCSWPDEDERIENFAAHVRKRARGLLGEDQARVEKFVCSIKDGIDIRETVRNWHTGDLYVKEMPPVRGDVGAVVFVFDTDFDKYPWRATWQAEHEEESTLVLYATNFFDDMVGPGIGRSVYGGSLFLFPPRPIPEVWGDERFDGARDPVERLALAGMHYSRERYVAYVSAERPSLRLRREARRLGRHLVFIPLSSFSRQTLNRLRVFHVLNGKQVRSYARAYIR